ncbi:MAG: hypothetical protein IJH78_02995 [Clostridia bacterium]|nr:hypothetical protein [Clostridia bacterium]
MGDLGALISSHIPALLLMIAGYVLIVVEMYIPGFGLPGISGIVLAAIGIVTMRPTGAQTLILVVIMLILLGIALATAMHSIRKGRLNRTSLVLHDAVTEPTGAQEAARMPAPGDEGLTQTALRPAGIVRFGQDKVNAQSEGEFIAADTPVCVLRIEGTHAIVRRKD